MVASPMSFIAANKPGSTALTVGRRNTDEPLV